VFADDERSYQLPYAQFLYAETTPNAALEKDADAPPEKLSICFAVARVTLLGSGLKYLERAIQKYELKFVRSAARRYASALKTHVAAVSISFTRSRMNPERKEILSLPVLPGRLTPAEAAWRLGFEPDHIPILVSLGLLKPLGHPTASTVKYFASVEIETLRNDQNGWPRRPMRSGTNGNSRTKPPREGLATAIRPLPTQRSIAPHWPRSF
jgi:hypothetical protein